MVVGSLINPKNTSGEKKGACQRRHRRRFFVPSSPLPKKKPKSLPSTLTKPTEKSFFFALFSLAFVSKIHFFFACVSDFVSLSRTFFCFGESSSLVQNSFCALLKRRRRRRRRPQRKSDAVRRWGGGAFRFPSFFFFVRYRRLHLHFMSIIIIIIIIIIVVSQPTHDGAKKKRSDELFFFFSNK